jgi:hypothetical protein
MDPDDLGYGATSIVGPLDMRCVLASQQGFQDRGMPITFDPSYIRHLKRFHGGVPRKRCFVATDGREYVIERFLHFADETKAERNQLEWYHVNVSWGLMLDRLNDFLIPFAVLFAGDMLCFDYEHGVKPRVAVWLHEKSREDAPFVVYVAANFDEFLGKLYEIKD